MGKNGEKIRSWKVVAFAIAVIVAICSFSYGAVNMGKKESGFHEIEAKAEDKVSTFDAGLTFMYYAEGSSNAIKHTLNAVREVYSPALTSLNKTLDALNIYEDCVNLATVNAAQGQPVRVSEALFSVLTDAYAKTREERGFNMFAGALWSEWQAILYLEEPEAFDPLNNPEEARRLAAIAAMVNDLSNFTFTVVDEEEKIVRFDVSQAYREFAERYEITAPALDLGPMREAYLVQLVQESLTQAGFTNGYLTAQSGLTAVMGGGEMDQYAVYGRENGQVSRIASLTVPSPSYGWQFVAISPLENAYGYFTVRDETGDHYRHMYVNILTGDVSEVLFSAQLAGQAASAADVQYAGIVLHTLSNQAEIDEFLKETGMSACYTLIGNEETLFCRGDSVEMDKDTGYTPDK